MRHYNLNRFYVCKYIYIYTHTHTHTHTHVYALLSTAFVHTDRSEIRQFLSKTQVKWNRQNDSR
jgi:hypothetical protein